MLSDEQVQQLRVRIGEELARLDSEIETLKLLTQPVSPDRAIGRLSRLDAMNEKSMHEAALRAASSLKRRLNATLPRLLDEDFGHCCECDQMIPMARLLSMPDARMCVACRERSEA